MDKLLALAGVHTLQPLQGHQPGCQGRSDGFLRRARVCGGRASGRGRWCSTAAQRGVCGTTCLVDVISWLLAKALPSLSGAVAAVVAAAAAAVDAGGTAVCGAAKVATISRLHKQEPRDSTQIRYGLVVVNHAHLTCVEPPPEAETVSLVVILVVAVIAASVAAIAAAVVGYDAVVVTSVTAVFIDGVLWVSFACRAPVALVAGHCTPTQNQLPDICPSCWSRRRRRFRENSQPRDRPDLHLQAPYPGTHCITNRAAEVCAGRDEPALRHNQRPDNGADAELQKRHCIPGHVALCNHHALQPTSKRLSD
mmetsp:Transcript_20824/g.41258  ORF Transcript_20824/g.41258 Transcript_20824/m.41258 type:complete len:309 (+) Transcript_20824:585-1511(+)